MATTIDLSDELADAARHAAQLTGVDLAQFVRDAVATRAADFTTLDELPYDDCGFPLYAPPQRKAA